MVNPLAIRTKTLRRRDIIVKPMKHAFTLFLLALLAIMCPGCRTTTDHTSSPTRNRNSNLARLSEVLRGILERGDRIPGCDPGSRLFHERYGARADYSTYVRHCREYNRTLAQSQNYPRIPAIARVQDDPIEGVWRVESWTTNLLNTGGRKKPGFWRVQELFEALPGNDGESPVLGSKILKGGQHLKSFRSMFETAAEYMDEIVLGEFGPQDRRLLRFVVPWICRCNRRFVNRSKGAPPYYMHWGFYPSDPFEPGNSKTQESGTAVPERLHSMTGLYHYLRALAGEPVSTTGICDCDREANTTHPAWGGSIDFPALGRCWDFVAKHLDASRLESLERELSAMTPQESQLPGVEGKLLTSFETDYGRIVVGGPGRNVYRDVEAAVIIDAGGDDDYLWRQPARRIGDYPLEIIVDFSGSDLYRTDGVGGPAAGIGAISVLVDRKGSDRYCQGLSRRFNPRETTRDALLQPDPEGEDTMLVPFVRLFGNPKEPAKKGVPLDAGFGFGAGFLGIGCLIDEAGDDLYLGQKYVFGTGFWRGVGMLEDRAGHDVYVAGVAAIGAGINGAFGVLCDEKGNDHYQCLGLHECAYSIGKEWDNGYDGAGIGYGSSWRAEVRQNSDRWYATLGGGIGIVQDAGGDDSYIGSSFGVASGYAGGMGIVRDAVGADTYFVKRGPGGANRSTWSGNHALGNGCHRGVGYLIDHNGSDRYSASGLGGGNAWDLGTGYLLDLGGDDVMTDLHGKGFRGNTGWAGAKAFAVSYHVGGRDVYERAHFGNAAAIAKGYPGVGGNFAFFLDVGPEEDFYPKGYDNSAVQRGRVAFKKEEDGKEYPRGIGLFCDGLDLVIPDNE